MKRKNTYTMLLESEEKGRSIFEYSIYTLVALCVAFSGWQFASHSVALPRMPATKANAVQAEPAAMVAKSAPQTPTADRG